jgi:hypothetical protein
MRRVRSFAWSMSRLPIIAVMALPSRIDRTEPRVTVPGNRELFPQIDALEAEEAFAPEFHACRNLLALAWDRKPTGSDEAYQYLLLAIFARSTLTYRAIMQLCRGGYGEQADMLNRSLFEDMATAHWVSIHRQVAVGRLEDHHQHSRVLWNRVLERRPGLGDRVDLGLDDGAIEALDAMFGKHGTRPWTGVGMWDLVTEIESLWGTEENREQLWRFYELAHRANNQKLHLSSFSLNRVAQARQDGNEITFQFRASPSIDSGGPVGAALFGAFWIYWQLTGLIWDVFGVSQDPLTEMVRGHMEHLASRSEEWKRLYSGTED